LVNFQIDVDEIDDILRADGNTSPAIATEFFVNKNHRKSFSLENAISTA
jgi:hypothetical protein